MCVLVHQYVLVICGACLVCRTRGLLRAQFLPNIELANEKKEEMVDAMGYLAANKEAEVPRYTIFFGISVVVVVDIDFLLRPIWSSVTIQN